MINKTSNKTGFYTLLIMIFFVWMGMITGISFLEAPLKFRAPNITLAIGLGIGRLVFGALNKIEIVFALSAVFIAFYLRTSFRFWSLFVCIAALLLIQSIWLLPWLDARAEVIIQGRVPEKSSPHIFYVVTEFCKLILLITIGVRTYMESLQKAIKSYETTHSG